MNRPVLQSHVPPASQTHCQSKFITITASPTPNVTTVPGGAQLTSTVSNLVTSSASSVIGVQEIIEQPNQPARLGSIISNTLSEAEADGFGELNTHTQGTEFYGPTGIFSFLLRLRARARSQNGQSIDRISSGLSNGRKSQDLSIVNLLHSSDYPVSVIDAHKIRSPIPSRMSDHLYVDSTYEGEHQPHKTGSAARLIGEPQTVSAEQSISEAEIERECLDCTFKIFTMFTQ